MSRGTATGLTARLFEEQTMKTTSDIFEYLMDVPEEKVRQDLLRIQQEQRRLHAEEDLLTRVLALRGVKTPPARKPDLTLTFGVGEQTLADAKPARKGSKRGHIQAIMRDDTERSVWRAADVLRALKERGVDMTMQNVRVTLRRMADAEQLEKVGAGQYQLRSPNGQPQEGAGGTP
jgi:hypothetical protein